MSFTFKCQILKVGREHWVGGRVSIEGALPPHAGHVHKSHHSRQAGNNSIKCKLKLKIRLKELRYYLEAGKKRRIGGYWL
jgi:hypothetical protein